MVKRVLLAAALIASAAIVTKPDEASLQAHIKGKLRKEFSNPTKMSDDGLVALIQFGCSFAAGDCANFVQRFMRFEIKDYIVVKVAVVRLGNGGLNCVGAFQNWGCFVAETENGSRRVMLGPQ